MSNAQLYLAMGAPILANAILVVLLLAVINSKFDGLRAEMNERFNGVNNQLTAMNQRFDDMRDLWRAELRRVEEVLDARLKHIEEQQRN